MDINKSNRCFPNSVAIGCSNRYSDSEINISIFRKRVSWHRFPTDKLDDDNNASDLDTEELNSEFPDN